MLGVTNGSIERRFTVPRLQCTVGIEQKKSTLCFDEQMHLFTGTHARSHKGIRFEWILSLFFLKSISVSLITV